MKSEDKSMQRIRYFDIAKGIGIICVVLGHADIESLLIAPSRLASWSIATCFSFHMPLFFIIAGYFMHPDRNFRWRKEARQLVLTYALTATAVVLGIGVYAMVRHGDPQNAWDAMRSWAQAAWYGSGDVSDKTLWQVEGRIGAIWFLLAMFWARLLMHAFARLPYTPLWVASSFVAGYSMSRYVWLPWSIQSGMCAVAFVYVGVLAREYNVLDLFKKRPWLWAVAALVWFAGIKWYSLFSLAMNDYGTHPVLAVGANLAGTACVVGISMLLDKVPVIGTWLRRAGNATLAILCVHLLEEDVIPWMGIFPRIHEMFPNVPLILIAFPVHMALDLFMAWVLYHIPVINVWFYPALAAKNRQKVEAAASASATC